MTDLIEAQDTTSNNTISVEKDARRWFARPIFQIVISFVLVLAAAAGIYFVNVAQKRSEALDTVYQYQTAISKSAVEFDANKASVDSKFQTWTSLVALNKKANAESNKYVSSNSDLKSSFDKILAKFQSSFDAYYTDFYNTNVKSKYVVDGDTNYKAQIATSIAAVTLIDSIASEQTAHKLILDVKSLDVNSAFLASEKSVFNAAIATSTTALQASIDAAVAGYDAAITMNTIDSADPAVYTASIVALEALKVTVNSNLDLVGVNVTNGYIARIDAIIAAYNVKVSEINAVNAANAAASQAAKANTSKSANSNTGTSKKTTSSTSKPGTSTGSTGTSSGQRGIVRNPDGSTHVEDITKWCEMFGCTAG